jgi:peptidoglycan-N-acetylglucosamine deacetylase
MGRLPTPSVGLLLAMLVLGIAFVVDGGGSDRSGSAVPAPANTVSAARTAAPRAPKARPKRSTPAPPSGTSRIRQSERGPTPTSAPRLRQSEKSPPAPGNGRTRSSAKPPAQRGGVVYLTFDDGPGPYTAAILDILRVTHSTATFFELGLRQAEYPTEPGRIRAQGSAVGNHTYNHPNLTKLTTGQIRWQIAHGPRGHCIRPPYGATDATVQRIMAERGLRQVLWTVDTLDWSRPGVKHIVSTATGPNVRAGTIVLMHDGGGNRSETVAALPQIITALQQRGYVIRRIPGC